MLFNYLNNLNTPSGAYDGEVAVNLNDLKQMHDLASKVFNEALSKPISSTNIQNLQRQQTLRVPEAMLNQAPVPNNPLYQVSPIGSSPIQNYMAGAAPLNYNQIVQPTAPTYNGAQSNTYGVIFDPSCCNTFADIATFIQRNKNTVPITWGKNTISNIAYKVSPIVCLTETPNGPNLHFNIDGEKKRIAPDKVIGVYTAMSALVSYFETMFNMCKSNVVNIELKDDDVVADINRLQMSMGTLALIKYRMERAYWTPASVNICGYIITADNGYLTIQKEGYIPTSIEINGFRQVLNSLPILNTFALNDDIFRMYQDEPTALTARLIIELNKAMNEYEIITFDDIAVLDATLGTQIKNSLLGKQMKVSENLE